MDVLSIVGAAVCMVGMCGVMMWVMMRTHRGRQSSGEQGRTDQSTHVL